jgi:hypothetical protein
LKHPFVKIGFLVWAIFLMSPATGIFSASADAFRKDLSVVPTEASPPPTPWVEKIESQWGGHVKVTGDVSWPAHESLFRPVGADTLYDGSADVRLKNQTYLSTWGYIETHYEAVFSGGDTRRKRAALNRLFPNLSDGGLVSGAPVNDDGRLMDLTKIITQDDGAVLYHRLDRFSLTLQPAWGTLCIGRQALTWGNGLIFNPMDLFNPFSPTDIDRDYKIGDDMAAVRFSAGDSELQLLYVPRRDSVSNDVAFDHSSVAGTLHAAVGAAEFDIMAARHFKDKVIGLGGTGYVKDAAWRLDTTYTFLHKDPKRDGFLSLVANMDYSWVWKDKNFYGLLEFYYNGLGGDPYSEALTDPVILRRIVRGEIFVIGKTYISGELRMELHPLFNLFLTLIDNLNDPSGIIQPRAVWDVAENVRMTAGGNLYYGKTGTEFGGFNIPKTDLTNTPPNLAFLWVSYFF